MITKKYYKLIRVSHEDSAYMRLKNISNESGIFKMVKQGNPIEPNLEYSLDGVTWTTYDFTTLPEVTVAAGANIYFRGTNANQQFNKNTNYYVKFSFNKTCEGHGNMCSLFNPDPAVFSVITSIGDHGLANCFRDCTTLTTAPDLSNVTTTGYNSLANCFRDCTSLVTAPDFSNLTTIGYGSLSNCFNSCSSLVTAPDFSNVTSVGQGGLEGCLGFCSSLVIAPDLSNLTTIGIRGLSYFLNRCSSLVTAPDFSNVTSVGQEGLGNCFANCSKLGDVTAPNISDLTTNNVLYFWLQSTGEQATGTKVVRVPTGATIATDSTSGIPTGWTRVDY